MNHVADSNGSDKGGISRRTLVRSAAWAVPVVALATAAPAFAISNPTTTPTFVSSDGCGTTGNGGGCANLKKAPQIPFELKNTTAQTLWFQVTGVKIWQGATPPANWSTAFGTDYRLFTQNPGSTSDCTPEVTSTLTCGDDDIVYASVQVQPGHTLSLWLVGPAQGAASAFTMSLLSRWVDNTCAVVVPEVQSDSLQIDPSANC